jgi:hypothetical protein
MSSKGSNALAATENVRSIRDCIFMIRGVQVMLDRDLAAIYQVSTSAFNQAVKRNIGRFPPEFRFQLTREEHRFLMSQIVISKRADGLETRGGVQKLPYAFTEQGIAMLSGVLKSEVAVQTSIKLMQTGDVCACLDDVVKKKELSSRLRVARSECDLIGFIGGPPCPDFSVGGSIELPFASYYVWSVNLPKDAAFHEQKS